MNYVGNPPAPAGVILVGDTNPIGLVGFFHRVPDQSYLHLNGQVVIKASYPDLWAYAQSFLTADQTLNPGLYRDVSGTTFAVPKLDGLFIRGVGSVDGSHVANALGVKQGDDNVAHAHSLPFYSSVIMNPAAVSDVIRSGSGIGNTGNSGGSEARPVNIALVPCVKALRSILIPSTSFPLPAVQLLYDKAAAGQTVVDFTNLVGYAAYRFLFSGVRPVSDTNSFCVRVSGDNGASFDAGAGTYTSSNSGWRDGAAVVTTNGPNTLGIIGGASVLSNSGLHGLTGELLTCDLNSTNPKWFNHHCAYPHVGGPLTAHADGAVVYTGALGVINAIRFVIGTGNFAAGRILCYGLRGA